MKIQFISKESNNHGFHSAQTIRSFSDARDFDDFDVNIIDLSTKSIWQNTGKQIDQVNCTKDLATLGKMIASCESSNIVIVYPQNCEYYYYQDYYGKYLKSEKLKDIIDEVSIIIKPLVDIDVAISFGITYTQFNTERIKADFFFSDYNRSDQMTISTGNKVTTIKCDACIITTLQMNTDAQWKAFLQEVGLIDKQQENIPDWFQNIRMFDDNLQTERIQKAGIEVERQQEIIREAEKVLSINNNRKSILYTQGEDLVEEVSAILDDIFKCNVSGFKDEKREDFRFQFEGRTVLGEIKGVKANVKKGNVSQLENHKQEYSDEHEYETDIVALLIINSQREKAPDEREPIHVNVSNLAASYGVLIIETPVLLKMYEMYKNAELTIQECWELISTNTGILSQEQLEEM